MATRSAIPGLVVARVNFSVSGIPWLFTMHGRTADSSVNTSAKMQGLADAIDAAVLPLAAAALNTSNTYTGITVADLSTAVLPDAVNASSVVGTRGSAVTSTAACVVTKRTGQVGRAFRGRCYVGGAALSDLTAGGSEWVSGYATSCQGLVEAVRAAFGTATPTAYTAVLYHRAAGQGGIPAADSTTPVTSVLGRTEIGVQRSRRK